MSVGKVPDKYRTETGRKRLKNVAYIQENRPIAGRPPPGPRRGDGRAPFKCDHVSVIGRFFSDL